MSIRTHDDRRPSKFIVLADNMRSAINMAWEHGGPDFQSRFDKSTGQAERDEKGGATGSVMDATNLAIPFFLTGGFLLPGCP